MLRLAEAEAYRPLWSIDILTELRPNVIKAGIAVDRVDRRIANMRRAFSDAMVTGYECFIDGTTNDPTDRYVLAAAAHQCRSHRTFNVRDFPDSAIKHFDIMAVHPDDFLLDQLDLYPGLASPFLSSRRLRIDGNPRRSVDCYHCSNGSCSAKVVW